MPKFWVPIISK